MEEVDTQALNKKLAEWVGCYEAVNKHTGLVCWWWPDGFIVGSAAPPQFHLSLDACFQWLVPKLERVGLWITPKGFYRWEATSLDKDGYYSSYYAERKNPVLALCRAIEKLIDSEVNRWKG